MNNKEDFKARDIFTKQNSLLKQPVGVFVYS